MTKTPFIVIALLLCLVPHIRAVDYGGDGGTKENPALITVSGTGQVEVEPTQAVVSIAIDERNATVQGLRREIDTAASNIIAYLRDQGIADRDIQTSYITISPHYPSQPAEAEVVFDIDEISPDYYTGQKAMSFVLRNLSNYDNIMSGLYDLGLNRVDGVTFRVEDEDTPTLEAKRRAVENARTIAQTMATELGVGLGDVSSITDSSYGGPIFAAEAEAAFDSDDSGSAGPSISGGVIRFRSNVNVVFRIVQ